MASLSESDMKKQRVHEAPNANVETVSTQTVPSDIENGDDVDNDIRGNVSIEHYLSMKQFLKPFMKKYGTLEIEKCIATIK